MALLAHGSAFAQPAPETSTLEEVRVEDRRDAEVPFDRTRSITTRDAEDLSRTQPSNIFDALRDVPGVSVSGGPRPSGMKFNIRGFTDNEDVLIRLDGVPKAFERYRFGGTFIDPDLLRSLEVQRGPQIQSGSGALGGTISATTKDAADFLGPGERAGARLKLGYATNNDEKVGSLTGYGRPTPTTDLLASVLVRRSNDITLSDGRPLLYSAVSTDSGLLKGSAFLTPALLATGSIVGFRDSGLQPYDATGGQPGLFGVVNRTVKDWTYATTWRYQPGNPLVNLRATGGFAQTHMADLQRPGETPFANAITGNVRDYYDYRTATVDIANTAVVEGLQVPLSVLTGVQWLDNDRDVRRFRERLPNPPDGFDPQLPPGRKRYYAAYVQPRLQLGRLEVVPSVRVDRYEVRATGGTARILEANRAESRIDFTQTTASVGTALALEPRGLVAFWNWAQAFRPPLIDEYFTQGAFSRCNQSTAAGLGPYAPASRICGDLYEPQTATSEEAGLSYAAAVPWLGGGTIAAKATWFWINTDHTLRSLTVVAPGVIAQPGWENRRGIELEAVLNTPYLFARAGYSAIKGQFDDGPGLYRRGGPQPIFNVPGDTFSLTAAVRPTAVTEIGVTYQHVTDRLVAIGQTVALGTIVGVQQGYSLWGAFGRWAVSPNVELRIAGDNLTNEKYFLSDGFGGGIGSEAPGRNVRFVVVLAI